MERMQAAELKPSKDGQQTYDFSKCSPSFELEAIQEKMKHYVDMVFEYKKHQGGANKGRRKVMVVKFKGKDS